LPTEHALDPPPGYESTPWPLLDRWPTSTKTALIGINTLKESGEFHTLKTVLPQLIQQSQAIGSPLAGPWFSYRSRLRISKLHCAVRRNHFPALAAAGKQVQKFTQKFTMDQPSGPGISQLPISMKQFEIRTPNRRYQHVRPFRPYYSQAPPLIQKT
jgi:hypothetical protein